MVQNSNYTHAVFNRGKAVPSVKTELLEDKSSRLFIESESLVKRMGRFESRKIIIELIDSPVLSKGISSNLDFSSLSAFAQTTFDRIAIVFPKGSRYRNSYKLFFGELPKLIVCRSFRSSWKAAQWLNNF